MNIANLLARTSASNPDAVAVAVGSTQRWTYAELASRVSRLAGALKRDLALEPGDELCAQRAVLDGVEM